MISAYQVWNLIHSKMKMKEGYKLEVYVDESNNFEAAFKIKSDSLDTLSINISSMTNPKNIRIEFTGSTVLETRPHPVNVHRVCSHVAGLLDRFISEALVNIPAHAIGRHGKKAKSETESLDRNLKSKINSALIKAGLDAARAISPYPILISLLVLSAALCKKASLLILREIASPMTSPGINRKSCSPV